MAEILKLPEGFQPTPENGLTPEEAEQRMKAGKGNEAHTDMERTAGQILRSHIFTLFNAINAVLGVLLLTVGSYRNMLFLGTVLSNTLIGTYQELRARKTLAALTLMNSPAVEALRGGKSISLRPEETVEGDLVILHQGDQVPADAVVVSGRGAADESMLTGESDAIRKKQGSWLLSGSYITEGRLTAQLVYVGDESYAARLTKEAKKIRSPKSLLMTEMNKLIRLITVLLVPLGLLLFVRQFWMAGRPLEQVIPNLVASMVGMIPNGLILLVSVALYVGVYRLGQKRTLVQEMYGIEDLARADVLCLDKTGTLTTGRMKAERFIPYGCSEAEMKAELSRFLGAFEDDNATSAALKACLKPEKSHPLAVLPFSSERKRSAASFEDHVTLCLGAAAFVWNGPLPEELEKAAAMESQSGCRVLVFARSHGSIAGDECPEMTELLGLCVLNDEIRESAAETLKTFRESGVRICVISGDDPRTVSSIAQRLGLRGAENYADVSSLDDKELAEAAERCTVFGRVKPEQKQLLVEALKKNGHKVAMTGDGVNDIPAMKAADCSIAMGSGSHAARQTAQLILLDSDFASLPLVVGEGRRVVGNITRASTLFLVKTLYSVALTFLMIFLPYSYPFQPIQLTLIAALTIGIPSFFLAMEPNNEPIRGSFLKTVLMKAIPGSAAVTLGAVLLMSMEGTAGQAGCSAAAALCAAAAGAAMLFNVCRPYTRLRLAVSVGMTALLAAAVLLFGTVFYIDLKTIPAELTVLLPVCLLLCIAVVFGGSCLMKRLMTGKEARG